MKTLLKFIDSLTLKDCLFLVLCTLAWIALIGEAIGLKW